MAKLSLNHLEDTGCLLIRKNTVYGKPYDLHSLREAELSLLSAKPWMLQQIIQN